MVPPECDLGCRSGSGVLGPPSLCHASRDLEILFRPLRPIHARSGLLPASTRFFCAFRAFDQRVLFFVIRFPRVVARLATASAADFIPDAFNPFADRFGTAFAFMPVFFIGFYDGLSRPATNPSRGPDAAPREAVHSFLCETRGVLLVHRIAAGKLKGRARNHLKWVGAEELCGGRIVHSCPQVDQARVGAGVLGVVAERRRGGAGGAGLVAVGVVGERSFFDPGGSWSEVAWTPVDRGADRGPLPCCC